MKSTISKHNISDENNVILTKLVMYWGLICSISIMYLGFRHIHDIDSYGVKWGTFAIMLGVFGIGGVFGMYALSNFSDKFPDTDPYSIFWGFFIALMLLMTQSILGLFKLSVSSTEKAAYYVFAATCEELLFRGFIVSSIVKGHRNDWSKGVIAIILNSLIFAALHQSYYGDFIKLFGVFSGGVIFSVIYIFKYFKTGKFDVLMLIVGHSILNGLVAWQYLAKVIL